MNWVSEYMYTLQRIKRCADKCWIDLVNSKLSMETSTDVLYENFERIIDKLEKEWFHLVSALYTHHQIISSKFTLDKGYIQVSTGTAGSRRVGLQYMQ